MLAIGAFRIWVARGLAIAASLSLGLGAVACSNEGAIGGAGSPAVEAAPPGEEAEEAAEKPDKRMQDTGALLLRGQARTELG